MYKLIVYNRARSSTCIVVYNRVQSCIIVYNSVRSSTPVHCRRVSTIVYILSKWFCYKMKIVDDYKNCDLFRKNAKRQSRQSMWRPASTIRQRLEKSGYIFWLFFCKINKKIDTIVDDFFQTSYTHLKISTI